MLLGKAFVPVGSWTVLWSLWFGCQVQSREAGASGSCLPCWSHSSANGCSNNNGRPEGLVAGSEDCILHCHPSRNTFRGAFKSCQEERWDLHATSPSAWWLQPVPVTSSFSWVPHDLVMISIHWSYNIKLPLGNCSSITFRFLPEIQSEICTEINIFQEERKQAKPT